MPNREVRMSTAIAPQRLLESEPTATLHDGTTLFYRAWLPPHADRAVILFHRGHEHSARLRELATLLAANGAAVFAWDQRGHGRSPGPRGSASSFGALVKDADSFDRWVSIQHGIPIER